MAETDVSPDISVSQLVNQVDKQNFTLYVEWYDTYFKIVILCSQSVPLSGEMHMEQENDIICLLEETSDTYLKKTRCAFSGKDKEIYFFLVDNILTWKQKDYMILGKMVLHPLLDIYIVTDFLKEIVERYQEYQEHMIVLKKENKHLNETNVQLAADRESTAKMMLNKEKDLYKKFILLLNSKKQKIRELQEVLDKKVTKSVYDETTDESEESGAENKNVHETNIKFSNTKKRKASCQNGQKNKPKICKQNLSSNRSPSPEPSTSKDKLILQNANMQYIMKATEQLLSTPEEESEDDIFS